MRTYYAAEYTYIPQGIGEPWEYRVLGFHAFPTYRARAAWIISRTTDPIIKRRAVTVAYMQHWQRAHKEG